MKKFILALLLIFPLIFTACSDDNEEQTTVEESTTVEETTKRSYSIAEMSPDTVDVTLPENISIRISDIDFESFTEIDAEDSVLQNAGHDKILESENAQYFFVDDDIKIHAIFFDENKRITCSASYNKDTGYCEFIGDNEKSWYFDENGKLRSVVYTFTGEKGDVVPVYTFCTAEGEKVVTRTMNGWYNKALDMLSEEEVLNMISSYSYTIEASAKY